MIRASLSIVVAVSVLATPALAIRDPLLDDMHSLDQQAKKMVDQYEDTYTRLMKGSGELEYFLEELQLRQPRYPNIPETSELAKLDGGRYDPAARDKRVVELRANDFDLFSTETLRFTFAGTEFSSERQLMGPEGDLQITLSSFDNKAFVWLLTFQHQDFGVIPQMGYFDEPDKSRWAKGYLKSDKRLELFPPISGYPGFPPKDVYQSKTLSTGEHTAVFILNEKNDGVINVYYFNNETLNLDRVDRRFVNETGRIDIPYRIHFSWEPESNGTVLRQMKSETGDYEDTAFPYSEKVHTFTKFDVDGRAANPHLFKQKLADQIASLDEKVNLITIGNTGRQAGLVSAEEAKSKSRGAGLVK